MNNGSSLLDGVVWVEMNKKSDLLLPLILMEDYQNDWYQYLEAVYQYFYQDFVVSKPYFENKRFALKRDPVVKGKEATFWHIISEGKGESERLPDLRRCERIRWPRVIINESQSGLMKCWKSNRKGDQRIVIALEDFSYVVVLADRDDSILLWTAYCVEQEHRRRKLRKEYEEYMSGKG